MFSFVLMIKTALLSLFTVITLFVAAQKENAPQLNEIYYTNTRGEKITGTVSVDEVMVFMIIKSTYAIGKEVLIKMDEGENFFYDNKFLGGGSSFKIFITENTQQIALEIYNPRNNKHVRKRKRIEGTKKAKDAKQ